MPRPPRRRGPPPSPPKQYTQEELRELGRRARELGPALAKATDQLNEAIRQCAERFVANLGIETRGRVSLCKNDDGFIEHLTFRNGQFFYESGWPGKNLQSQVLLSASREIRILAAHRLLDLWSACGGTALPVRK